MRKEHLIDWRPVEIIDNNDNGIPDEIEPPQIDVTASARELRHRLDRNTSTDPQLTAGDIDASWEEAESSGDETPGGGGSSPDQNGVEEIGTAIGVIYRDGEELHAGAKERARDEHRWELDPASADDFIERMKDLATRRAPRTRLRH